MLLPHAILSIALALAASAGEPQTASQRSTRLAQPPTPTPKPPVESGVDKVLGMKEAGLSDALIITRLRKDNKPYDLTTEEMKRLKQTGLSDAVLQVMMDPAADVSTVQAPPAPAQAVVPAVAVAPVLAAPVVATPNPSGATPAAGSAAGDPNDPMTPHDSGIYLFTKDRDGNPVLTVLERAAYQGAKTGGVFAAAMTYGIKKAKTKAVLPGPRASIRISEAQAEFYFYFDDKAAGLGRSYFGITNLSNPNQFALIKLEAKEKNRETVIGTMGVFSASSGTDEKSMVPFKSERLRPGLYRVRVESIAPGEYCFLASSPVMGAHAAGAAGAVDIFDFGVNSNR